MLLSSGADPDKCSFASMFPLYWATLNGFPEIVSILLDFKANPNLQNNNEWTPLYVACRNGNYEIATQRGVKPCWSGRFGSAFAVRSFCKIPV
jgi:ankyrin repeat protein